MTQEEPKQKHHHDDRADGGELSAALMQDHAEHAGKGQGLAPLQPAGDFVQPHCRKWPDQWKADAGQNQPKGGSGLRGDPGHHPARQHVKPCEQHPIDWRALHICPASP